MRKLALAAIRGYQRYLSPHKGFCCAYRAHTGRAGCSELGYRAIRRYGVFSGLGLVRQRTARCADVHRRCATWKRPPASQRGDCDFPCNCDLPGADALSDALDWADVCNCGCCDWPDRDRRKRRAEKRTLPAATNKERHSR